MSTLENKVGLNRSPSAESNGTIGDLVRRLLVDTDGEDVVEYALLTAFIGFAGAAAWSTMRTSLGNAYVGFSAAVWNIWEPADPVGGGS